VKGANARTFDGIRLALGEGSVRNFVQQQPTIRAWQNRAFRRSLAIVVDPKPRCSVALDPRAGTWQRLAY
jgi:hypothetical protein